MAPQKGIRIRSAPERVRDLSASEDGGANRRPYVMRAVVAFFFFAVGKARSFVEAHLPVVKAHLQNAGSILHSKCAKFSVFGTNAAALFLVLGAAATKAFTVLSGHLGYVTGLVSSTALSEYKKFREADRKGKIWRGIVVFVGAATVLVFLLQAMYFSTAAPPQEIVIPKPARIAATWPDSPIPGTNIHSEEDANLFREQLVCSSREGKWEEEPMPRLLPWPTDKANLGHCEERWINNHNGVAEEQADEVVHQRLPGTDWRVRPGLKYVWKVDKWSCGLESQLEELTGRAVSRLLTGGQRTATDVAPSPAAEDKWNERVLLVVGDSSQYGFASSIYDNLRMGDPDHGSVPLVPTSLPCFEKKLAHRMVCWGVHFFANTQPGLKMVFVRNDFSSPVTEAQWARSGKHFQVPWITTLSAVVQGDYEWLEGGDMPTPGNLRKEEEIVTTKSLRGNPLPPIVILSRGQGLIPDEQFLRDLNNTLQAARQVCPLCIIFFRNTPGGHKDCHDVEVPLEERPEEMGMNTIWESTARQSQDPLTKKVVEAAGAVFLDVESMTAFRADGHTGKNRHGDKDCRNYCAPGPLDSWTKLLFHSLKRMLQGQDP